MNFKYLEWNNSDFLNYRSFLKRNINTTDKIKRRKTIVKTSMPVLAIYSKEVKVISDSIYKESNYFNYLNNNDFYFYEETIVYGNVLSQLNDFDLFEKYFKMLSIKTDNWATVDNVKFKKMYKLNKERLFNLAIDYLNSELEFERRFGILILFEFIEDSEYNLKIFAILNNLFYEDAYYVNIACAWLLCEMFIKEREITLKYFKSHQTNKQIINKAIQKCRDSFRVNSEDKEILLDYKI